METIGHIKNHLLQYFKPETYAYMPKEEMIALYRGAVVIEYEMTLSEVKRTPINEWWEEHL